MEIREIETFLKVAATQNFSKAAENLGYSQSAVTVQIQKLEKELGVALFERIGKRAFLTEKGREFTVYAGEVMRSYNAALNFAKNNEKVTGFLKIGGVESVCTAFLPGLLPEFYNMCPDVEVVIKSGVTENLISMLESNDLDMIITLDEKIFRKDLECRAEKKENIVLVTKNIEECEENKIFPLEKLCTQPFIMTERGAPYRNALEKILSERELKIDPILEIGNTETIINLLKKGMGISLLPEFTVADDIEKKKLSVIKSDFSGISMYLQLICHKSKCITGQMEIFSDLVRKNFK